MDSNLLIFYLKGENILKKRLFRAKQPVPNLIWDIVKSSTLKAPS